MTTYSRKEAKQDKQVKAFIKKLKQQWSLTLQMDAGFPGLKNIV